MSELDGSAVTVGTQPGIDDATRVVVLRLQSSLLDVLNAVYLLPVEARRLAEALSSAAVLAVTATPAHPDGGSDRLPGGKPGRPNLAGTEPADPAAATASGDGVIPDENDKNYKIGEDGEDGEDDGLAMMHTVTASEGASAAELRDALGTLPSSAELVDFGADADVVLIFATTPRANA
ncbi:hypothetical protein BCD49_01550 [Pseudofrankia sp. EUN1h]|nr:hypothetical protein BCD49_01550 [Pseudofrankia sp. EUN1h]